MPLDRSPQPEALDVADDYNLAEVGESHRSLDQVFDAFAEARSWWVSTVLPSGRPHAVPVWGVVVDDHMLFCSDGESAKSKNLARQPELVVHLESGDVVAIIEADATTIAADDLPASFADVYEEKYGNRPDPTAGNFTTHEVHPVKVMSWDEADFAATAARWRFDPS